MHFRTRAFLLTFIPLACLLGLSFLLVQGYVKRTVRIGLLNSLRQSERQVAQLRDENNRQNARLLASFSQDIELKSAIRNFRPNPAAVQLSSDASGIAAPTPQPAPNVPAIDQDGVVVDENVAPVTGPLQDQLLRFGVKSGLDFIMVISPDGTPMAGAIRGDGESSELVPLFVFPQLEQGGLVLFRGEPYQTGTAAIEAHGEKLGSLILGEHLKRSAFATSTVLLHHDYVMQTDVGKDRLADIGQKLHGCKAHSECTLMLDGVEWLTMPIMDGATGADWSMYSLVNVDDSLQPVAKALRRIFLTVLFVSLMTALICSYAWSRAIVRPIAVMVTHLHDATRTGQLPEFSFAQTGIKEMRDLEKSFNNAAASVRKANGDLNEAYLQFVYSLANALDARDCYTAGHSKRVSDLSCSLASTMGQGEEDVERLRVGALLHDIGKIGIPDAVLQHPGKLTNEAFKTIKTHPLIGRHILQGVQGFADYLPAVELHHENWDGTGYPKRKQGEETPLDARIIHVADAYDAMTTDRAYRKGMDHDRAMKILAENAGTQFDPDVVSALYQIFGQAKFERTSSGTTSVENAAAAPASTWDPTPVTVRTKVQSVTPEQEEPKLRLVS